MISSAYWPYLDCYGTGCHDLTTIVLSTPFDLDQPQMEEWLLVKFDARLTLLQPAHFTTTFDPSASGVQGRGVQSGDRPPQTGLSPPTRCPSPSAARQCG